MLSISTVMDREPCENMDVALVRTLAKGLDLLAIFAGGELLGNQQIAHRTGLAKATASRLTTTLATLGYLRFDEVSRKYSIGSRLLAMSASVQHRLGLITVARPHMQEFARATGMTVGIGTRDRLGIACLEVARPDGPRLGTATVGTVWPMAGTAIGLSYLAEVSLKERTQLLRQLQMRHGTEWSAVRSVIHDAITQYGQQGFVTRVRSCEEGVSGAGVSLHVPAMNHVFSFNCATLLSCSTAPRFLEKRGAMLAKMVEAVDRDFRLQGALER